MVYDTLNYLVFGLCPSSGILKTREYKVSETLCSLVFRISDDGQVQKTSNSEQIKLYVTNRKTNN
jgi:hypothetical protein